MASRPRRIAAAEWDGHKDTILNLRQSGKSIKGEDGIMARMERDCEFEATPAQYELQLRKWGARKNINANEWRRTLQAVDQYNEDGIKCAVYKNGELVQPWTLQKERNRHCKGQEYARLRRSRVSAAILPECIEIKISESQPSVAGMLDVDGDEDRDEDGDENALSSVSYNLAMTTSETTPVARESHVGAVGGFGMGDSYIGSQIPVADPFLEQSNQTMGAMSALANDDQRFETSITNSTGELLPDTLDLTMDYVRMDHDPTLDMVSLVRGSSATRGSSLFGPDTMLNAVSYLDLVNWSSPDIQFPGINELLETRGSQSLSASPELPIQQAFVHRQSNSPASRDGGDPGGTNARQLVTDTRPLGLHGVPMNSDDALLVVETIELRLSSLLISDAVSSNHLLKSRTAVRDQTFGSSIYGSLILSIENNFAGLDGVPIGAVLKFLEQGPQMRSQLSKYLRAAPKNVSKILAENLVRAAIENCDAPMVTELLRTELVAPNDIVCSFDGMRYTAVERSAMLHSIEVTKVLLNAGADVNKTYSASMDEKGALYFAIQQQVGCSPVDMELSELLLDHGAKVRLWHAAIAVRWQEPVLIKALLHKIPPSDYQWAFISYTSEAHSIIQDAVRLDDELATTVVVHIVQACYQTNYGKCSEVYSSILQESMKLAATRGYSRLVAFLVDHVADKGPALAGAVRSGKRDVIELLLEKGANPDAPECIIDRLYDFFPTTPFAEAIRAKDDELICYFHGLGATSQISEEGRFEAAIYAASEAGKLTYVNELMQMAPGMEGKVLNSALRISIRKGYEEVALTLLKAGADVNWRWDRRKSRDDVSPVLREALRQKNKTLVLKIMECDADINILSMEAAAEWGDVSIIENLLSMGADINHFLDSGVGTAVTVAVRAKNRPLVEFLVENGARLDLPVDSGKCSSLMAAISNEDIDMMRYLLDLGADPSCSSAINEAVKKGGEILAIVLDAVRIKFPMSIKDLGAEALQSAIEKDDVELVDILLEAKFDVNTIVENEEHGCISALGMAIEKTSGTNLDVVKKLILAGGDPNSIVSSMARWRQHTVWPRLTAMLQAILRKSKPLVELFTDEGADIKRAARLGLKRTPLQQACEVGAMEIVDLFLEKGVDVNEAPAVRGGATSLQFCAIQGFCAIAKKLLERGADVHALPSEVNGRTALDGAAENGRLDMLMLLWNATADKRFSPEQCSHAMKLAEENGHIACYDLLRQLDLTSRDFMGLGRLGT